MPHSALETMEKLLRGHWSRVVSKSILRHQATGCERCHDALDQAMTDLLGDCPKEAVRYTGEDYEASIDKVFATTSAKWLELQNERRLATRHAEFLLADGGPFEELSKPLQERLASWGLCEELLARSFALRHDDPERMVQVALSAVSVARRLDHSRYGRHLVIDLKARALAELGNAYRVADDLARAEQELVRARNVAERGTRSRGLAARIAELTGSLRGTQRRFHDAFRELALAKSLYTAEDDRAGIGRVLISNGLYNGYYGDLEQALDSLRTGLEWVDPQRDPKLQFIALHNIVKFTAELGHWREARTELFKLRPLYKSVAGHLDRLRLRHLEGTIALGLGELARAERALETAKDGFRAAGLVFHAALAELDLCVIWLLQGRTGEVHVSIHDLIRTFRDLRVERELLAAVLILGEAIQKDALTVELVEATVRVLWRLER